MPAGLRVRTGENLANPFLECGARLFADEVSDDVAIAAVENCFWHGAGPRGVDATIERIDVDAGLLAIARKAGLIASEKAANEIHVRIIVEADTEDRETLRSVLLLELNEHGEFVAARFAPCCPERDDERFAAILGKNLIVTGEIDQGQIGC